MRHSKVIFKITKDNRGKVYIGHKWQRDITGINIHGAPYDYAIEIEQYQRDSEGRYRVVDGEVMRKTKTYKFGRTKS